MKYHHRLLAVAAFAVADALLAQAADATSRAGHRGGGPGGPGGPGAGRGNPVIRTLDTDHNHEVSAEEISLAPSVLSALDLNADGVISVDEMRPARPTPPAGHARPTLTDPVMFALDANGDGNLALAEIANSAASLRSLDANGDGKLTRDELRPLPPGK